ncbi:uncharacterized protein LOC110699414 [Chenopodium quinoa]|uniref:uncharacterized protein LOC110699414 n=1 Tax=Chenopodium quinoa TaxID=63459 RepID=UPI000B77E7F9|nr:uncharacterized protein LOC110699414 [Chenopodium quinoa]
MLGNVNQLLNSVGVNESDRDGHVIGVESETEQEMEGECETEGSDNLEDNNDDCPDSLSRSRVNINEADNSITEYRVLNSTTEVNKRGPTMMHKVHMRPFENREAIILNEFGQPIGPVTPEKDTPGEFSRFLGTIARDYGYVPLIYNSWHYVSNKEKMWEYVLVS